MQYILLKLCVKFIYYEEFCAKILERKWLIVFYERNMLFVVNIGIIIIDIIVNFKNFFKGNFAMELKPFV